MWRITGGWRGLAWVGRGRSLRGGIPPVLDEIRFN